jgi:hypothetical protein
MRGIPYAQPLTPHPSPLTPHPSPLTLNSKTLNAKTAKVLESSRRCAVVLASAKALSQRRRRKSGAEGRGCGMGVWGRGYTGQGMLGSEVQCVEERGVGREKGELDVGCRGRGGDKLVCV